MQCAGCENELVGRYYTHGSRELPFCPECMRERFCLACELPAFYVIEKDGYTECARCSATLPECAACGAMHTDRWWKVDSYTLCENCGKRADNFGLCLGCGHLDNRDRQNFCRDCDAFPVESHQRERVEELLEVVMSFLEREFEIEVRDYCKLKVVPRKQFRKKGWNSTGLYSQRGEKRQIFIEEGLPEALFLGTLAHEAVHAWQAENCPAQTKRLSEGLATWVEFKVLEACDILHPSEWFEKSLPTDYQEAFRLTCRWEESLGARRLLQSVREWSSFP